MDTILMSQAFILYMCLQTTDTEGKRSKKTDKHNCFSGRRRQMIFWLKKFGHLMKEGIQVYILEEKYLERPLKILGTTKS